MAPDRGRGPLTGVRVLDLTDALGAYAGRLLGDLGADVVRVDPPGAGGCQVAPFHVARDEPAVSLFERFVNAGKRSITLDVHAVEAREVLARLLASTDILLESGAAVLGSDGGDTDPTVVNPRLVRVLVTPFGREVPHVEGDQDDLLLLAAGGLLHLGGYPDAGPVAAYGSQSRYAAATFGAVAALAALIEREQTGRGGTADVSAQECIAQALEDSLPEYVLTGNVRGPRGDRAREAGTGVYRCADGWVSVVAGRLGTSRAWGALVEWLAASGSEGTDDLLEERWSQFAYRQEPEAIERFQAIFERFAATRTREELYRAAQGLGIALCPVNDMRSLLGDRQLAERRFFVEVEDPYLGHLTYPGTPYRLHGFERVAVAAAPVHGGSNTAVYLDELGLSRQEYESLLERGVV